MKSSIALIVKWTFALLYFVFIYAYLYKVVNLQLHYHVQQPTFITTTDFFRQYLLIPGMLSEYIANFLSQFFYISWLGPLVIIALAAVMMWAGFSIFRTFEHTTSEYFFMFLPVSFLLALFNNYYFPFLVAVQVLISYLALWMFISAINKKLNHHFLFIIIALSAYYIAGSGSFMIFSASSVLIIFYLKRFKKGLFFLLTVLIVSTFIPYIAYKYLFNIPVKDAYLLLVPDRPSPIVLKYEPDKILYFFYFYLPAAILLLSIATIWIKKLQQHKQALTPSIILCDQPDLIAVDNKTISSILGHLKKWLSFHISVLIIIGVTFVSLTSTRNKLNKNISLADYYCYHEKWNKVIDIVLTENNYYDLFLNYFYNRAIDNNGHYIDMYFNYPQMLGSDCLFPDRLLTANMSIICSDYYFDLGYISEAHHWAYETQSIMPYSPRILERLVMTNLIFGNYIAAENLLTVLSKTFFSDDFINKYRPYIRDTSLISSDKLIMEKRAFLPRNTVNTASISDKFYNLIDKNIQNKRAMEHLAMYYLLNNQLDSFATFMPKVMKFYKITPRIFEEALLLYLNKSKKTENLTEFNISDKTREEFMDFKNIINWYGVYKKEAQPKLKELYGNSYQYYLQYNSPMVTGLEQGINY